MPIEAGQSHEGRSGCVRRDVVRFRGWRFSLGACVCVFGGDRGSGCSELVTIECTPAMSDIRFIFPSWPKADRISTAAERQTLILVCELWKVLMPCNPTELSSRQFPQNHVIMGAKSARIHKDVCLE